MVNESKLRNVFSKANYFMAHNVCLKWLDKLLLKSGVPDYIWGICDRLIGENQEFKAFCALHREEFNKLSKLVEDDFSRVTIERVLEYRKTRNPKYLKGIVLKNQYFLKDLFGPVKDEVFIDCGAYEGDTAEEFIKKFAGGGYKRIYAWEPDEINFSYLQKIMSKYENITLLPYGVWSTKTELLFSQEGTMGSSLIEANASKEAPAAPQTVKVDTIDNLCSSEKVTFIKMDIEGAELEALKGAINVIKRDKPRLAICIYHKPEDFYEIPFWIKSVVPEYKLYIRHHAHYIYETVVYATV